MSTAALALDEDDAWEEAPVEALPAEPDLLSDDPVWSAYSSTGGDLAQIRVLVPGMSTEEIIQRLREIAAQTVAVAARLGKAPIRYCWHCCRCGEGTSPFLLMGVLPDGDACLECVIVSWIEL